MRDAQIVLLRRLAVIDLVELGTTVIRSTRALIALRRIVRGGGGDDRHARLRQGLFQRLERCIEIVRPAIRRRVADRGVVVAGPLHVGDRRIVIRRKAKLVIERAWHGLRPSCVSKEIINRPSARPKIDRLFFKEQTSGCKCSVSACPSSAAGWRMGSDHMAGGNTAPAREGGTR